MPEPDMTTVEPQGAPTAQPGPRPDREFTAKERTQWQMAARRFLKHRIATICLAVFVLLVLFAFLGPHLWRYNYAVYTNDINVAPDWKHPFGTDSTGYDQLAKVMYGTGVSLKVAFTIAIIGTGGGSIWGVVSGFFGGVVDSALMRLADLILTLPALAIAAAVANNYGGTWFTIGLILGIISAPYVGRVVRGVVLSLREKEFIEASRALGASNTRIMMRHLLPNTLPVLIVNATLLIATGILGETALSYLGFGIQPPDTSLGLLITAGQSGLQAGQPWLFYIPGVFVILVALTVNFIGDGLRDALDPRQTRERR